MLVDTHCFSTAVKVLRILLSCPPPSLRDRVTVNTETPVLTGDYGLNAWCRSSNPDQCNMYYVCTSEGRAFRHTCAEGTLFSVATGECMFEEEVVCKGRNEKGYGR